MTQAAQHVDSFTAALTNARDASAKLEELSKSCHLISPATSVSDIPDGHAIAISIVHVDPSETYNVGSGSNGLSASALRKLEAAAGVSWTATGCYRTDDARDPYFCAFRAEGFMKNFDGTERNSVKAKTMDLRDGSPVIDVLQARLKNGSGDVEKQLRELRMFIQEHANTKAELRVIRALLSLKSGYTVEQLKKPFACAKLMFTGKYRNPQTRAEVERMQAAAAIFGKQALFGGGGGMATVHAIGAGAAAPRQLSAPGPVGMYAFDDDDRDIVEVPQARPTPAAARQVAPRTQPQAPRSAPTQQGPARELSGVCCPFGKNKGVPIEEIDDGGLTWWRSIVEKDLADDTKSRFHGKARKDLAALDTEIAYRANPPKAAPAQAGATPDDEELPPGFYDDADRY